MSNFGRCIICTLSFELDDISALRCGHTYHHECILTWINTSKSCPKCRKKNLVKDITRLYVDEPDKSMCQADFDPAINVELEIKVKKLEMQLDELKNAKIALEVSFNDADKKNKELKKIIDNHKEEMINKLKIKEDHIKQLEGIVENQNALKQKNDRLSAQLKACEFYSLIRKMSTTADESEIEKKIDKYSNSNGDPSSGEFLKLIRKQLKTMEQKNKELGEQLRKERLENYKKNIEIEKIRDELSRKRYKGPSTSNDSPVHQRGMRPSFGFSFLDDSEIQIIGGNFSPSVNFKKNSEINSSCQILEERKVDHNQLKFKKPIKIFDDEPENISPKPICLGNDLISPNLLAHANNSNFMNP